uniref:Uncharacterized protein n=1 Tax=Triticum urartu TaxID=4572 RepID=A0A8R7TKQ6_TRIUA
MEFPKCPTPTAMTCTTRRMMASSPTPTPSSPTPGRSPVHKSEFGHGGSADAAGATKEEEGSGGLPAKVCLARADGRQMPARIRCLRPRHPQGGAATITYPTMGQHQFMEGKLLHLEHIRGSNKVCTTWFLPLGQYKMC